MERISFTGAIYNLKDDPNEFSNLARKPSHEIQLEKLKQLLVEAQKAAGG